MFEGFTVGYHPRSWEIVYNGMTQYGYEKAYKDYSFDTHQSRVYLYKTAVCWFKNQLLRFLLRPVWRLLCLAPWQQGVHRQLCLQRY
ncbi:hypothetical protein Hanom_Chr17g01552871 [Helianthus anomalus]